MLGVKETTFGSTLLNKKKKNTLVKEKPNFKSSDDNKLRFIFLMSCPFRTEASMVLEKSIFFLSLNCCSFWGNIVECFSVAFSTVFEYRFFSNSLVGTQS